MRVDITQETTPWTFTLASGKALFSIVEAKLTHERFDGGTTRKLTRVNFERGDAVCVVVYAEETDEVVLVEQFRYPAYAGRSRGVREPKGWLIEVVAGMKDADGRAVAEREVLEETGCELSTPLELLSTFYVSPGASSERIELYLARVRRPEGVLENAGIEHEGEDIRPLVLPLSEALKMVHDGRIEDAKTMLGLLMLRDRVKR